MERSIQITFLFFALHLSQALPADVITGVGRDESVSPAKSMLYGAVLGAIVSVAASLVPAENRAYLSAFYITAGSAAGLGYYFLHSARNSMKTLPSSPTGVTANFFSWNF